MRKVISKEVTAGGRFDFFLDSGRCIRFGESKRMIANRAES